MKKWAAPVAPREQLLLLASCFDDQIPADHPIRLLDGVLGELDWVAWEAHYHGFRGQPPIHPRLLAGAILYGLMRKVRSSRDLEEATSNRLDFIWLLEGRTVDHSTFAGFRTRFAGELKALNREIAKAICQRGRRALLSLVLDGTRMRANSDRHGARTAQALERLIGRCTDALNEKLRRLAQTDDRLAQRDDADAPPPEDAQALETEIDRLTAQLEKYQTALQVARERDRKKQAHEKGPAVRVPVTDPDASLLPNKEGGYAPNYTPTVAVDQETGAILAAEVVDGSDEAAALAGAVEACQETLGKKPARVLADQTFATGDNLASLAQDGIAAAMPTGTDFRASNPANRPDPTQPVAPADWPALPRYRRQLARTAFIYDKDKDCYYCPQGRPLSRVSQRPSQKRGIPHFKYRSADCAGCPLAAQCVTSKTQRRTLTRDVYQGLRDAAGRRLASPEGRAVYRQRAPVVEGVFGLIKQHFGIRQFLLRGLARVRTEWHWICAAYNLKKLLLALTAARGGSRPAPSAASREARASGPSTVNGPAVRVWSFWLVFDNFRSFFCCGCWRKKAVHCSAA
jgi:transposase